MLMTSDDDAVFCPACGAPVPRELVSLLREGTAVTCEICGTRIQRTLGNIPPGESPRSGVPLQGTPPAPGAASFGKNASTAMKNSLLQRNCPECGYQFDPRDVETQIKQAEEAPRLVCPRCGAHLAVNDVVFIKWDD